MDHVAERTALYGRIKHEINCNPVKNPESDSFLNSRAIEAMRPKTTVKFGDAQKGVMKQFGHESATSFIVCLPFAGVAAFFGLTPTPENRTYGCQAEEDGY
jgi:hypothetical protein